MPRFSFFIGALIFAQLGMIQPLALPGGFAPVARATAQEHCSVGVVVNDPRFLGTSGLGTLELDFIYPSPAIELPGSGADVSCEKLPDQAGDTMMFDDDDAGTLGVRFVSATGVPGLFTALFRCMTVSASQPQFGDFSITVGEALDPDGDPLGFLPNVVVDDIECGLSTTTTTTSTVTTSTSSTTSTTLEPPVAGCSDPFEPFGAVTAPDCLFILRAAVQLSTCPAECLCAPKGELPPASTDALLCLQHATGQDIALDCPCS